MQVIFNQMVKYNERLLDRAFAALGDPKRRAILVRLRSGERTVGDLAAPFRVSLPAISKHLTVLEKAGLVERRRNGRERTCRLRVAPLGEAARWLEAYRVFWEGAFDWLGAFLDESEEDGKKGDHRCNPTHRPKKH
jgi:DNA-binding transcriptional ArsR family regulator